MATNAVGDIWPDTVAYWRKAMEEDMRSIASMNYAEHQRRAEIELEERRDAMVRNVAARERERERQRAWVAKLEEIKAPEPIESVHTRAENAGLHASRFAALRQENATLRADIETQNEHRRQQQQIEAKLSERVKALEAEVAALKPAQMLVDAMRSESKPEFGNPTGRKISQAIANMNKADADMGTPLFDRYY